MRHKPQNLLRYRSLYSSKTAINKIMNWFLKPMVKLCPDEMSEKVWLEFLFDVENRSIKRYYVKAGFTIPGYFKAAPLKLIQGMGPRFVRNGSIMWVRIDKKNPDQIDCEVNTGKGNNDRVFVLTNREWVKIKRNLEIFN